MAADRPVPAHGTRARYQSRQWPCRCPSCSAANNRYQAAYRAGAVPPLGVQLELPVQLRIRVGR